VGRVVTFNYNTSKELASISVTAPGITGAKTEATFAWATIPLNFNYSVSVVDSPANATSVNVLSNCAYANSTGYTFTYGDWGLVDKIAKVSANGTVRSYVRYDYPAASAGALSDHPTYQHQIVSSDGTSGSEISWTYAVTKSGSIVSSISVTDPPTTTSTAQKTTTTNLITSGVQTGLVSSVVVSTGTTNLRTVANTWTQDNTTGTSAVNPRVLNSQTTLNDSGQTSQVALTYDTNGNVTQTKETDFSGSVSRITNMQYLNTSSYVNLHILDRPSQVTVTDGASTANLIAQTNLAYDGNSLTSVTGATGHDDTNFSSTVTARGNLSSITRYTNAAAGTGAISRQFTYDTLGNLLTAQVDCCQQEQWGFGSDNQYAYPETLTRGPSGSQLVSHSSYDLSTGLILTSTDENGQQTQFSYDNMNRLKTVTRPGSIQSTANYDDTSAQPVNSSTTPIDSSKSIQRLTTSDGLGRVIKQQLEDVSGTVYSIVDTQYDALGRVSEVSNPHGSSATAVFTQRSYDALSRVIKLIPPDGSSTSNNTQFSYSGNSVLVTDPAGKQRRSFTDSTKSALSLSSTEDTMTILLG
jgi:YD repeat-containing protein